MKTKVLFAATCMLLLTITASTAQISTTFQGGFSSTFSVGTKPNNQNIGTVYNNNGCCQGNYSDNDNGCYSNHGHSHHNCGKHQHKHSGKHHHHCKKEDGHKDQCCKHDD